MDLIFRFLVANFFPPSLALAIFQFGGCIIPVFRLFLVMIACYVVTFVAVGLFYTSVSVSCVRFFLSHSPCRCIALCTCMCACEFMIFCLRAIGCMSVRNCCVFEYLGRLLGVSG